MNKEPNSPGTGSKIDADEKGGDMVNKLGAPPCPDVEQYALPVSSKTTSLGPLKSGRTGLSKLTGPVLSEPLRLKNGVS